MPTFNGTSGNDTYPGSPDPDTIIGEGGDDTLNGAGGDDSIYGGEGNDRLNGDDGDDLLVGDAGDDIISGGAGNDRVSAGMGNDLISGGPGADFLAGGDDNDTVDYALSSAGVVIGVTFGSTASGGDAEGDSLTGVENLIGSAFNDSLTGDDGANRLQGGAGADVIQGGGGNDELASRQLDWNEFLASDPGLEQDQLSGGAGDDSLLIGYGDSADGGDGNDRLHLSLVGATSAVALNTAAIVGGQPFSFGGGTIQNVEAVSHITGTNFDDALTLAAQGGTPTTVYAGLGNDTVTSSGAQVNVHGGEGNDVFVSDGSSDIWDGDFGFDTIDYSLATAGITITLDNSGGGQLGAGGDILFEIEHISGSNHADVLTGNGFGNWLSGAAGNDVLNGGAGNDTLNGGGGDDLIDGGSDTDTASYAGASAAVVVTLASSGWQQTGGAGRDALTNIENLTGSSFADTLSGNAGSNFIAGGLGLDTLTGSGGTDYFFDTAAGLNGDVIVDLGADDMIVISDLQAQGFQFTQTGNTAYFAGGSITSSVPGTFVLASYGVGIHDTRAALKFVPDATAENGDARFDFNGDGRSDVLWRQDGGAIGDWLGRPDGGFTINNSSIAGVPAYWQIVGVGDFNGDGRDDILWRGEAGEIGNWTAAEDGTFSYNAAGGITGVPNDWTVVGVADFNDDGHDDILWRHESGLLGNWLATEGGGFSPNNASLIGVPTDWEVAGLGDFDGDGHADILWRNSGGPVGTWSGNGDGSFTVNATLQHATADWHIVGTGDFNGDGNDDILWRSEAGLIGNWLGTDSGEFVINNAGVVFLPTAWHVASIGDYNGDGFDDVALHNDNGSVTDWLGRADGGFTGNDATAFVQNITDWSMQDPSVSIL